MRFFTRCLRHFYHGIAYQIRLTKIRYRYSPVYAIGWLLGDILLRLTLIILPIILLLWQFINPQSLPQIPDYPEDISYNFVKDSIITIEAEHPIKIIGEKTALIAQSHYQIEQGFIEIPTQFQQIKANHMVIKNNIIDLKENVSLKKSSHNNFQLNTEQMIFHHENEQMYSDKKTSGNFGNYQFNAIGFTLNNRTEILTLKKNVQLESKENTLLGKNGMVLAFNENRLSIDDAVFVNSQGVRAIADQSEGVFEDNFNKKYLKKLHFLDDFAYNWQDSLIKGDEATIYFKDAEADYMIINGHITATMPERVVTADEAYLDYVTDKLEMCGNTEIITKGGREIKAPCAVFSLTKKTSFNLRQKKTYLQ